MGAYATRDDVFTLALSAQAFVTRPRPIESVAADVNPSTGVLRLSGNGYSALDRLEVFVTPGGWLPIGLTTLTPLYPLPMTSDLFQLAATPSGSAIAYAAAVTGTSSGTGSAVVVALDRAHGLPASGATVTVAGVVGTTEANGTWKVTPVDSTHLLLVGSTFANAYASGGTVVTPGLGWSLQLDPGRRLDAHLVEASAEIDEHLTAHLPPILPDAVTGKLPQILIGLTARMAARAAVASLQIDNAAYKVAVDRLLAKEEFDRILLADWKAGKPIQPRPTDEDTIADNAARASAQRPVCWTTGRL